MSLTSHKLKTCVFYVPSYKKVNKDIMNPIIIKPVSVYKDFIINLELKRLYPITSKYEYLSNFLIGSSNP